MNKKLRYDLELHLSSAKVEHLLFREYPHIFSRQENGI